MIGQLVLDRYRIDNQIGVGGMGVVYRAHDTKLRRDVAIKFIASHLVEDPDARSRFLREAQALAGLSHPNIVTVFDLVEDTANDSVFIVMELLTGSPLRKCITDPNRPTFFDMAIQLCRALECAHGRNILHRDIKPENIFVCTDGTIKLMDFGLARLVDGSASTTSGVVTGTVSYMSPEQVRGGKLDARSDLYSLGILFYEYLCGYTPFASDTPATTLYKHMTELPPSLRARVPSVTADLEALIMRLLAKEPGGRFASALILRDMLERMKAGAAAGANATLPLGVDTSGIPLTIRETRKTSYTLPGSVEKAPRKILRAVILIGAILLSVVVAIAAIETANRTLFQSQPAKTETTKKKPVAKPKPTKRTRPVRTKTTGARSAYPGDPQPGKGASDPPPSNDAQDGSKPTVDGTAPDTPSEQKPDGADPNEDSVPDKKPETDTSPNG